MNLKTFYEKFERFADAPGAVPKMRELVLGLAVQGKLVEQHSTDGSAADLVTTASSVRAKLIKEKKLRKPRAIQPVAEFDLYPIPNSWAWTSLGEITEIGPRNDVPDSTPATFLPMPAIPQQYGGKLVGEVRSWGEIKKGFTHLADGDIALGKITPCFQNGKSAVIEGLENGIGAGTTELHVARPFAPIVEPYYIWTFLRSPQFLLEGIPHMTGSAGQKRVPTGYFACKPLPLPPLAEQKRIVAKVDALMALCDQLEAQQAEREAQAAAVQRAARHRFHQAPGPDTVDYLFHSAFNLKPSSLKNSSLIPQTSSLRQSILTLAVQGKLVPQDPGDERADDDQRQALKLEVTPFDIPDNWKWSLLEHLSDINGGFAFKSSDYKDKGTRVIRISDFDETGFKEHRIVRHPFEPEFEKFSLEEENILMAMTGGTVGKSYYVSKLPEPMVVNQRVATIKVNPLAVPRYIDILIRSELTQRVIQEAKNSTNDNISMKSIKGFLVPLPPLTEQRRIVTKVDQLMGRVDQLEAQLEQSRSSAQKLLEALIAELTTAKN